MDGIYYNNDQDIIESQENSHISSRKRNFDENNSLVSSKKPNNNIVDIINTIDSIDIINTIDSIDIINTINNKKRKQSVEQRDFIPFKSKN